MSTKIIITYLDKDTSVYDSIDHYSDDGEFLTITSKYTFPNSQDTYVAKINLRNIIGYTIIVKEEIQNG